MSYKEYSDYKESDIHWAMQIPTHWNISKLKRIFQFEKGKNSNVLTEEYVKSNEGSYPVYSGQTKNKGILGFIDSYEYDFKNNVILVTTVGAKAMTTFLIKDKLSLSQNCALIKLKSEDDCSDYYYYLCKILFNYERGLIPDIMQPSLRIGDLNTYNIIKPSLEEQKRIANYLDKQTAKIDATIAKNEELIQLLEEKRVALINQVVTKGLNPDMPMKDSGVEWIGEIPEHWGVEKIKNLSQVKPSNVDKKTKDNEPLVLLCNYTDVYNNEFITMDLDFMKATATYDQIKKLSLNVGDIIITKDSESADDIAVPAIVTEKLENVVCGYHLAVIRPNEEKIYPKFLFRSFESDKINKQFEHGANGVTRFGLGTYPINNAYVCQPPLSEQKEIANYLDNENSKIYKATNKIMIHTDLLEEYKTSLIHNVVTGKIDVREEVI